jgi:co-chaperonin GroES (HSP10)
MSSVLFERKVTSVGVGARMRMVHVVDPKEKLLEEIGDVPPDIVNFNKVLVAIYRRPEKTAGGIILTDRAGDEDVWQGKVGLIVAMGPLAFTDDDSNKFHGVKYEVGDWVWFRPSSGTACQVKGVPCRVFISEGEFFGRIPDPDCVW